MVVQHYNKGILFTAVKDERPFKAIHCQAIELVIDNEGVVYYIEQVLIASKNKQKNATTISCGVLYYARSICISSIGLQSNFTLCF